MSGDLDAHRLQGRRARIQTEHLTISISPELKDLVQEVSDAESVTKSYWVRGLIIAELIDMGVL